jgi:hypothetical protein
MESHLTRRGFVVDRRVDAQATRAGIVDGYERLVRDAAQDEPVVVFYSGHGARAEDPRYEAPAGIGAETRRYVQAIIPFDYAQSKDDDFRGILAEELSLWLARLTGKTRNVAVLLDCCHAGMMSRDARALPKSLPHPLRVGVAACLDALAKEQEISSLRVRSNPDAVRLAAARVEQSAYELPGDDGRPRGVFTAALLAVLDEVGDRAVSWRTLGERVRDRVLAEHPAQRPEIEGPAERRLFALTAVPERLWQPIRKRGGATLLSLGLAQGVHVGDELVLMPDGAEQVDEGAKLGKARVGRASAAEAWLEVEPAGLQVPEASRAFQVRWAAPRRQVVVEAEGAERAAIVAALVVDARIDVVSAGETVRPVAIVRVREGRLELHNRQEQRMVSPEPFSPAAVTRLATNVRHMIHAQSVREIEGSGFAGVRGDELLVEWGLEEHGKTVPLPLAGAAVGEKDTIYLRVQNLGQKPIYVSILDVGLADGVTLISEPAASGMRLEPQQAEVINGIPFVWPHVVPRDGFRSEEVLFFATGAPCDLSALLSGGVRSLTARGGRLQQLLEQSAHGGMREFSRVPPRAPDGFLVERISFDASPWEVERRDAAFLVDDRRPLADVVMRPRRAPAPRKIAVRLTDVLIHKNRDIFSAEVRVDVLVVTGSRSAAGSPYRVETLRFPRISDGNRLPLEKALVYHGEVHEFVDLCVWVSRDEKDSLSLADLLASKASSPEVQGALGSLLALGVAAPQAALVVAAVGGAATLATVAYELLSRATGDSNSIGLYRTSLLAQERFGVGRHPEIGLMRAQDFSFGYEVIDVS